MTWLLDTNACVDYLRAGRSSRVAVRLLEVQPTDVVLCSVVRAELIYGALKSRDADANIAKVNRFVSRFASAPFDDVAADVYAHIRAGLVAQGMTIGPNDLLIAAIALAHDFTLVTHNIDEFSRVPELRIEDWEIERD